MFLLSIALSALASCLWPVPVEEWPPRVDLPPRAEPVSPDPSTGAIRLSTQCQSYNFLASVEDPDPDDTIYWRVFIDYERNPDTAWSEEVHPLPPLPAPQTGSQSISIPISTVDQRFGPNPGLTGDPHFVELLIADRPFFMDARTPLGRVVQENGLSDSIIWTVVFTQQPPAGGCPSGG